VHTRVLHILEQFEQYWCIVKDVKRSCKLAASRLWTPGTKMAEVISIVLEVFRWQLIAAELLNRSIQTATILECLEGLTQFGLQNHSETKCKIMAQSWHNFSSQAAALISAWVRRMDKGLNQLIRRQISSRSSPKFMAQLVTDWSDRYPAESMLRSLTRCILMRWEGKKN